MNATAGELQRLEEIATLLHLNRVRAIRQVLGVMEPFIRGAPRRVEDKECWKEFDRLLLLAAKKWECLRDGERELGLAEARAMVQLLKDLGELV